MFDLAFRAYGAVAELREERRDDSRMGHLQLKGVTPTTVACRCSSTKKRLSL